MVLPKWTDFCGPAPDIAMAEALIAAIPPVVGRIGHLRSKPDAVLADKG